MLERLPVPAVFFLQNALNPGMCSSIQGVLRVGNTALIGSSHHFCNSCHHFAVAFTTFQINTITRQLGRLDSSLCSQLLCCV